MLQRALELLRAARRALRRLLLESGLPGGPRRHLGLLLAVAVGSFALGAVLPVLLLPGSAPAQGGEPSAAELWRVLLPGRGGGPDGYEGFLDSLLGALRARPLGTPSLAFALAELTAGLDRDSLWLEFGVWMGGSLSMIGRRSRELGRPRKVFGFDSFQGLPENWRNSTLGEAWQKRWTAKGSFDLGGHAPDLLVDTDAVDFVVGWFNESLPLFLDREAGPVTFVHIDSDLYSSAALVLGLLTPRLVPGAVLVFDELVNYPGFRGGEARALYEWLESPGFRDSGLTAVQVVGYRGPNLLSDEATMAEAIKLQRGEGRKYPQDAVLRVW